MEFFHSLIFILFINLVRTVYTEFKFHESLLNCKVNKWKESIENIEYDHIVQCIRNINQITICVKLQNFQYRILLRIQATETIWVKINPTDLCSNCGNTQETVEHLLID